MIDVHIFCPGCGRRLISRGSDGVIMYLRAVSSIPYSQSSGKAG